MKVTKRNGELHDLDLNKITNRIAIMIKYPTRLDSRLDATDVAVKTVRGLVDGIKTSEIDILSADVAAGMTLSHPDYAQLASRILISNLHKTTHDKFPDYIEQYSSYFNDKILDTVRNYGEEIHSMINDDRDYLFDYFGFKTLEKSYLFRDKLGDNKVKERPQWMFMRVAIQIWRTDNLEDLFDIYNSLSKQYYTHATPTMYNAGFKKPQLSSCFLFSMYDDSIEGIYDTLKDVALISKHAGGVGISISNVRSRGDVIRTTNGNSGGIIPMIQVFNSTARYVDQGGKRKGSFAMYLEPWHTEIFDFLDLRKNTGKEEMRARDIFTALTITDHFMECVENDRDWYLMSPDTCPDLIDLYGDEFTTQYMHYVDAGMYIKKVKARQVWDAILSSQVETGTPYILFKDAANKKSNQKNLGTIRNSNLCAEILEYSDKDNVAVCNLASIILWKYVKYEFPNKMYFDYDLLHEQVYKVCWNLDAVIDVNYYPIDKARNSNMDNRPIGLGVQGLFDVFHMLELKSDYDSLKDLNNRIFETIYHAALMASCDMAKKYGEYKNYFDSPIADGQLQFDMWDSDFDENKSVWDWKSLREKIKKHGVRNSLLIAMMPTASTAQIHGSTESTEPPNSNMYLRRVLSGEFVVVNKHLVKKLDSLGLWDKQMVNELIAYDGSVQSIDRVPQDVKDVFKTVWEVPQKMIIDLAADRGKFICQTQSMNIHLKTPTAAKLTSSHFHAWKSGLKTGIYYLRSLPKSTAIKGLGIEIPNITSNTNTVVDEEVLTSEGLSCSIDDPDCESCGA